MEALLLLCIFAPLAGACLLPLVGKRSESARNYITLGLVVLAFLCALGMLPAVLRGQQPTVSLTLPLGLSFGFRADALALFMAMASTLAASVIVVYAFGYMKEYPHQDEFYFMVALFIGAMMGLVFSTSLVYLYVFWEISSLCCWRLIGFYRHGVEVERANKAFLVTVFGALLMLVGFLGIYGQTGTFELTAMRGVHIPDWSVVLILCGILSKSATFPLHGWLPDAGVAPSPATSLLHAAVLVKIGVYAYARLFVLTFEINPVFTVVVPIVAAVSALFSAGCAMLATDIKREIAYSTISQLAFILLGLSSGTKVGFVGGLLYIFAHSLAKGGLFLCAGIVEHNMHTKDFTKLGGLARNFPVTAVAFVLCSFSVMGIPPFVGFFAKYLVIDGVVDAGHPWLGFVFILGAIMTVVYLSRVFIKVFLGPPHDADIHEGTRGMTLCALALGVLSLLPVLISFLPMCLAELAWGGCDMLLVLVAGPVLFALLALLLRKTDGGRMAAALSGAVVNLAAAAWLLISGDGRGILRLPGLGVLHFEAGAWSRLLVGIAALSFLLTVVYTVAFFRGRKAGGLYLPLYLASLGFVNGALLCDNLFIMLFFWEGLLCTMTGMLLLSGIFHPKTATKALAVAGTADLLLMFGIICTVKAAGTAEMANIAKLPVSGAGAWGCVCLLLGAMGKAGAMPFHSWIPAAAKDAPTPFMAAFPGALEKIVGIYLTVRVVTGLYDVQPGGHISLFICIVGAVTLFFGVGMALVQKDMKKLLSYHAVSQVGYMLLGIGTALPVGVVGGVFHMLNNVLYKGGLFIAAGAVEWRTGSTDLHALGGLGRKMPVTAVCFLIFGLSIAGFPGTNGFFSKELIFDAALETGLIWYLAALLGAFMTAVSFLKMTRAAFFGKEKLPEGCLNAAEATAGFTVPMCVLALCCLGCGVFSKFPVDLVIGRTLGMEAHFGGFGHCAPLLVAISCAVLALAVLDHIWGSRRDGGALNAADHIHYAPVLRRVYAWAEVGLLDPYNWFVSLLVTFSKLCVWVERGVSWVYDRGVPALVEGAGLALHKLSNGNLSRYLLLALGGVLLMGILFLLAQN